MIAGPPGAVVGGVLGFGLGLYLGDKMFNDGGDGPDKSFEGKTPDDSPKDFKPGEQSGDKINKDDGSIWSPDRAGHSDSKWKRWPNKRDRRDRKNRQSVRSDGSCR